MTDLHKLVAEKFTSGNSIEVERITITRTEYEAAIAPPHSLFEEIAQTSFINLWQNYCDKKQEVESLKARVKELEAALAQPEQEPVHFLANGVRYKVTHQGYYGCSIVGLPENLNGQWVALVEATDSKHLNCIAPQESTKPEQEPVCDKDPSLCGFTLCQLAKVCKHTPRNTMPTKIFGPNLEQILNAAGFYRREWQGLTDEDEQQCRIEAGAKYVRYKNSIRGQMISPADEYEWHLICAIEAKLKEKNA